LVVLALPPTLPLTTLADVDGGSALDLADGDCCMAASTWSLLPLSLTPLKLNGDFMPLFRVALLTFLGLMNSDLDARQPWQELFAPALDSVQRLQTQPDSGGGGGDGDGGMGGGRGGVRHCESEALSMGAGEQKTDDGEESAAERPRLLLLLLPLPLPLLPLPLNVATLDDGGMAMIHNW